MSVLRIILLLILGGLTEMGMSVNLEAGLAVATVDDPLLCLRECFFLRLRKKELLRE